MSIKRCGVIMRLPVIVVLLFAAISNVPGQGTHSKSGAGAAKPQVLLLDGEWLQTVRRSIEAGDRKYDDAIAKLKGDVRRAMSFAPVSVMQKARPGPSGDKHDYTSIAPYFWPDPTKPDGRPYIRKDGEVNPETKQYPDHEHLDQLITCVDSLALGYYLLNDEAYAEKAGQLLRIWFLDSATKMNPNLTYAQAVLGQNDGRGIGLIETRRFAQLIDDMGLLAGSKSWTPADQRGMQAWYSKYLVWLTTSKNGTDESKAKNNHGTFYDVQLVSIAFFSGQRELAKRTLQEAVQKRLVKQIEPDGSQPLELERTKAWGYSVMNLSGLFLLAAQGERLGVDVWNYQSPDGRSLKKALDWLLPFALQEKKWTHQQIKDWSGDELVPVLRQAELAWREKRYHEAIVKLNGGTVSDRGFLLYSRG